MESSRTTFMSWKGCLLSSQSKTTAMLFEQSASENYHPLCYWPTPGINIDSAMCYWRSVWLCPVLQVFTFLSDYNQICLIMSCITSFHFSLLFSLLWGFAKSLPWIPWFSVCKSYHTRSFLTIFFWTFAANFWRWFKNFSKNDEMKQSRVCLV